MATTDDYVARIPQSPHGDKPLFVRTVEVMLDPLARYQSFLASLPLAFDIDYAVGVQQDAVGVRVGVSRFVPYPLQGLFFSWDDPLRGWDRGIWKGPYDTGTGIYRLDDDTYRRLQYAKVLANYWDGTIAGEQAIFDAYFVDPATHVFVSDDAISALPEKWFSWDDATRGWDAGVWAPSNPSLGNDSLTSIDMAMTIGISGKIPNLVDLAILNEGLIGAKPEGVTVNYEITSVDGAPVFGFDVENEYVSGWDTGAWGVSPAYLMAHQH